MPNFLIPRVKVNYTLSDILKSLFVGENKIVKREKCKQFLATLYNNMYICFVPSSRDAIYELLIRLPQKKVIIPTYTCMVVNEAVRFSGKEVVFAKTDVNNFNSSYLECIDSDSIVLATHQYGLPCNIEEIARKCKETGSVLIEDCATSLGTTVNGQLTGTFGNYAVISFNASKTLNVPPFGGILISKDVKLLKDIDETAEWENPDRMFKIKGLIKALAFVVTKNSYIYRAFHWLTIERKGKLQRTEHETVSKEKTDFYKYRFTEWQACFLWKQLNILDKIIEKRKYIYAYYDKHINNPLVVKPILIPDAVCTRYAIRVDDRKNFYKKCLAKGVDMDFSHCNIGCPSSFVQEHRLAETVLNLPLYYDLSYKEMRKVVEVVNSIR